MLKYTVKRLAQSLVTILLIATIVFLLMRCLPTDYYFTEEQLMKFTEEQKYAALEAAGLTDPIGTQLLHFYNDLLHLDFGTSRRIQNGASVVKVIGKKFGVSMRLGLISAGISLLVGIMLGILQTAFKDKVFDWIGTAYTVFVNAVPSLVSYSLVLVFGSKYLGFPTLYSTRNVGPSSVLPIVCLSLASIAGYALWTRRYMVDELTRDYIKLARVKGLSSSEIMFKHVLRNAMVPMVQYIPQSILLTVGGSLLMERFFSVPGMGPLRAEEVGQQGRVQVQCLAASAGQQRRKTQRAAFNRVLNAVKVALQLQRFAAALRLFRDLGVLGIVVGVKGDGRAGGHRDFIGCRLDLADLLHSRGDLRDDDAARHQGLQGVDPCLRVNRLLLGLDLAAFAEALLPQGQRAGEGQVDVRVEALRVVHGQAAHFQHPVKDPLQVKQRDIGGLAALLKEDSYCSQSTVLRSACWHRRRCTGGCRAGSFLPRAPCCTRAPDGPLSRRHPDGPRA